MGRLDARRTQTDVPIGLEITRDVGITGLTVVLRLYNGDDFTEFLDFNDGVFKAAGHTTPTLTLDELGFGFYGVDGGFDFSAITIPAATSSILAVYDITAGGEVGNDVDVIQLIDEQMLRDAMKLAPTAGAPAAGSVDDHLDEIVADTAAIEPLVSANLDDSISNVLAATTAISAAIAALNDLSQADVQAAMTAQGYTTARAALIDNLDVALTQLEDNIRGVDDRDLSELAGAGFTSTDTLEEIRNAIALLGGDIKAYPSDPTVAP